MRQSACHTVFQTRRDFLIDWLGEQEISSGLSKLYDKLIAASEEADEEEEEEEGEDE